MPDYSKGKIYKIECNETGEVYYGSTVQALCDRMSGHRTHYRRWIEGKVNKCQSYDIIERGNYSYSLVEDCPCERKEQLIAREKFYIKNNECVNKCIPGRTREEILEYDKKRSNEFRKNNPEKRKEVLRNYYVRNKDKINEKGKKYREAKNDTYVATRERHAQKDTSKVICPCCITEMKFCAWRKTHQKSKQHLANLAKTQSGMTY